MIFREGHKKTNFPQRKSAREEYEEYLREKNKHDRSRIVSSIFAGDSSYYLYKQRKEERLTSNRRHSAAGREGKHAQDKEEREDGNRNRQPEVHLGPQDCLGSREKFLGTISTFGSKKLRSTLTVTKYDSTRQSRAQASCSPWILPSCREMLCFLNCFFRAPQVR